MICSKNGHEHTKGRTSLKSLKGDFWTGANKLRCLIFSCFYLQAECTLIQVIKNVTCVQWWLFMMLIKDYTQKQCKKVYQQNNFNFKTMNMSTCKCVHALTNIVFCMTKKKSWQPFVNVDV